MSNFIGSDQTIQLIGAGVRDSCGKSASKGDHKGAKSAAEAPGTARGKRVPRVEINVQSVQTPKKSKKHEG